MELSKALRPPPAPSEEDRGGGQEEEDSVGGGGGGGGGGAVWAPMVDGGVGEEGHVGGELAPEPELLLFLTETSSSFS